VTDVELRKKIVLRCVHGLTYCERCGGFPSFSNCYSAETTETMTRAEAIARWPHLEEKLK
jgi:hypothetical protein